MMELSRRSFVTVAGMAAIGLATAALTGCDNSASTTSTTTSASSSAASSSAAEAASYKLVTPGKLTVGSDLAYPPMEYLDGDTPAGFGIAMIEEVAKRLGLEADILSPQNFDTLITQVASGTKMDVSVSSITITDDRKETVDFSTPYFDSNLAVVVLADSDVTSTDDLKTASVGCQSGSTGEDWIRENLRDATCKPFNTPAECLAAVRTGDVVAAIYDDPVAENNVAGEYDDCKVLQVIATGEQYGIAINKENTQLTADINQALADMEADGTLDDIYAEWIGGDDGGTAASSAKGASED